MHQDNVYAGFWLRFVAWMIDMVVLTAINLLVSFTIGFFMGVLMMFLFTGAVQDIVGVLTTVGSLAILIVISWLYYALMESSVTQGTLGKMALRLKVTDMKKNRISFGKATARYFAKLLSYLTLDIGFLIIAFTKKKQGLHDLISDCLVIKA